jgi:hypothetical protein
MVRAFVKSVILVVALGLLHGLLFLPVFLSILVPASQYLQSLETYEKLSNYLASQVFESAKFAQICINAQVPRIWQQIGNKRMQAYRHAEPDVEQHLAAANDTHRRIIGGLHALKM